MAGQPYSLTCTVQVVQYLAAISNVTWLSPDGNSLQNGSGITVGKAVRNGNITTLRFTVDELAQSHAGNFTCRACISIGEAAIEGDCGYAMAEVTLSGKINDMQWKIVQGSRHTYLGEIVNVSMIWYVFATKNKYFTE